MRTIERSDGIVSLVSTIILGLLLLIIITGLAVVMVGVQRQATDDDQSTRAYYAAESGVEDALLTVKANLSGGVGAVQTYAASLPSCGTVTKVGTDPNNNYVCQQITVQSGSIQDSAPQDYANQYEVNQSDALDHIDLYWNSDGKDNLTPNTYPSAGVFPAGAAWTYPAVMELTDSAFQTGDKTLTGTIGTTLAPLTQIAVPASSQSASAQFGSPSVPSVNAMCQLGPISFNNISYPYNCHATFNGFSSIPGIGSAANHIFRLRPRYGTTGYEVQFYKGSASTPGNLLNPVTDSKATIDVTAKSGSVLRRVQAKVQIKSTTATGLDYVLFADNSICKNFKVNVNTETSAQNLTCI